MINLYNEFFSVKKRLKSILQNAMKIGFFHLLSANLLVQLAGFGSQLLLTRILPIDDMGRIRVIQSFISIIIIIATLGINITVLKICSEDISMRYKKRILSHAIFLSTFISMGSVLLVFIISFLSLFSKDSIINGSRKFFILQVPFLVISSIFIAYLQSQNKLKIVSKVQITTRLFVIIISIIFTYFYGLNGYLFGIVSSNILSTFIFYYVLKDDKIKYKNVKLDNRLIKKLLTFGSLALGTSLFWQLFLSINVILANYLVKDNKEIAFYGTAQLMMTTLMMVPTTLNQIMIPHVSRVSSDLEKVLTTIKVFQKRMLIVMSLIVLISFILIPILVPLFFGKEYVNSIRYLKVLLIGLLFWSYYSTKNNALTSIGKFKQTLYVNMFSFICNLITSIIFMKFFGMMGAAYANTISFLITIFINNYYFNKTISTLEHSK